MSEKRRKFAAFYSYLQIVDLQDSERLSKLRESLEREVEIHKGEPFTIFQDRQDISWGQAWKERIDRVIDSCTYLIAIISPGYFSSEPCRKEFEHFLQRERELGATELILPIIYIDTPALSNNNNLDPIVDEIKKRQWVNWIDLRHEPWGSPKITKRLEILGRQISDLIERNSIIVSAESQESNVLLETVDELPKIALTPIAPPQLFDESENDSLPPRLITVFLRPSGDYDRDRRRIKNIYGILISAHGKDRFQFQVFENGKGHLIDFPMDSTHICPDLLIRLKRLIGEEAWRIEEIAYQ